MGKIFSKNGLITNSEDRLRLYLKSIRDVRRSRNRWPLWSRNRPKT